jgi:hypothetical protein
MCEQLILSNSYTTHCQVARVLSFSNLVALTNRLVMRFALLASLANQNNPNPKENC